MEYVLEQMEMTNAVLQPTDVLILALAAQLKDQIQEQWITPENFQQFKNDLSSFGN